MTLTTSRQSDGEHHYRNAEKLAPLLADRPDVDGITVDCLNAIAVYRALRLLGRRVPDDVAVVGFNSMAAVASQIDPALTTVGVWGPELGRSAVRLLNDVMAGRNPDPVLVPCRLFERWSVRVQESTPVA